MIPEDQRRIEEEERYRAEVRARIRRERILAPWNRCLAPIAAATR